MNERRLSIVIYAYVNIIILFLSSYVKYFFISSILNRKYLFNKIKVFDHKKVPTPVGTVLFHSFKSGGKQLIL